MAVAAVVCAAAQTQAPMTLRYDRTARVFRESLPIGNGKMGALIYGGTDDNVIFLNDITLWTGKPVDKDLDRDAHQWIPKIREALFSEDYRKADSLQRHVQGPNSQFYQPLATLHIRHLDAAGATGYYRELSLDSAIARDHYTCGTQTVSREYFASAPDHLIAIRLKGRCLNLQLSLTGQTPHHAKATNSQITMTGHATGDPQQTIHFCTILKAKTDGQLSAADSTLTVSDATEVTLYIVNETSFNGYNHHPVSEGADYLTLAANAVWHTENISYDEARQRHVDDYRHYYDRVRLRLGANALSAMAADYDGPTDQLLRAYTTDSTLAPAAARYLETLYFQYGRYLLIA